MKITLIYPGIAQIGFGSFGRGTPAANLMNLGLGYVAACIKANSSHTVDLIDLRKLNGWEDFRKDLKGRSSDMVGIYVNTVNFDYAIKCAETAHNLGIRVLAGGPHATLDPRALLATGYVQHVITGEGELSILDVIRRIDRGLPVDQLVKGIPIQDLDSLPFPDRDLFDLQGALTLAGIFPFPPRYVGVLASRGCGFDCSFCQPLEKLIFGKKIKYRSVENVIREVQFLKSRYKVEFVMFQDDQLTQNRKWLLDLCAELKGTAIQWGALARVDTVSKPTIAKMADSGCVVLQFGFESGSQRILDFLRKKATVEGALAAARLCREHGILIFANYMMGIPTETLEDLQATYRLLKEINPEIHAGSYFSPIPGSDIYDFCRDSGLINVTSYDMYVRGPVDNKIKGIDYKLLGELKKKMEQCTPLWYQEKHYASCVLNRWLDLLKRGHYLQGLKELITHTPVLNKSVGAMYHRLASASDR